MGKSWNIPRFDVYDPSLALYAPLWRPDMVARGGSIVNGTGTMDVSPQNPAVGANTITVTAAGTLTVRMPEGGTVASGTMTVTGSPVTVSAGIATTITTTGATGNITVTPNNIIRSKDRNNHAMTITGAIWGYQTRTFDSVDDNILVSNHSSFNTTGNITVMVWFWHAASTTVEGILSNETATGWNNTIGYMLSAAGYLTFRRGDGATAEWNGVGTTALDDGNWHFGVGIDNGTGLEVWADGVQEYNATPAGYTTPASATVDLYIGRLGRTTGFFPFGGGIGEVIIKDKALVQGEHENIRLETKWRYA